VLLKPFARYSKALIEIERGRCMERMGHFFYIRCCLFHITGTHWTILCLYVFCHNLIQRCK